jgi:hypothetical protein
MRKNGADLTRQKGEATPHNARPGNKNAAHGPRIGRERGGNKSGQPRGKAFAKGQNSHTGEIFRRGPDQLPVSPTLMFKVKALDQRQLLSERIDDIIANGTRREFLALYELMGNRIDGLPTKRIEKQVRRTTRFILMMPDGKEIDAMPPRKSVGSGPIPAPSTTTPAPSTDDERWVGLERVEYRLDPAPTPAARPPQPC